MKTGLFRLVRALPSLAPLLLATFAPTASAQYECGYVDGAFCRQTGTWDIEFGPVAVGETTIRSFSYCNGVSSLLTGTLDYPPGDFVNLGSDALSVPGQGTQTFTFQFQPSETGNRQTIISVSPADRNCPDIRLIGTGLAADLVITKNANAPTANEGDLVTFTVVVQNGGPNNATSVVVSDVIPAGLEYSSHTVSAGTYDVASGLWDVGAVPNGVPETLTLIAQVLPGTGGTTISNVATRDSSYPTDTNAANDSDSAPVTILSADLVLAKVVDNSTPNAGDVITYNVSITNDGPNAASDIEVTDLLESELEFESATPTQGTYTETTGIWSLASLANGGTESLAVQARVNAGTAGVTIPNVASITSVTQADPDPSNNSASTLITVQSSDLQISKTVDNDSPNVGSTITYTISATNLGVDAATSVAILDLLPTGLTYLSHQLAQGTYDVPSGVWSVGTLVADSAVTLMIDALVDTESAGSDIANTASVLEADQEDPNSANNADTVTVSVSAVPLLTCSIAADFTYGTPPLAVNFEALISGGLPPFDYSWLFGDGTANGIAQPAHVYETAGEYVVSLLVTDSSVPPQTCDSDLSVVTTDAPLMTPARSHSGLGFTALPTDRSVASVLADLGAPDPTKWRLGHWSPSTGGYLEVASGGLNQIEPGLGYWLITASETSLTPQGKGVPAQPFVVQLESGPNDGPGWNQLANPFHFTIPTSLLTVDDGNGPKSLTDLTSNDLTTPIVKIWDGSDYQDYGSGTGIPPGAAFWVEKMVPNSVTLTIPFEEGGTEPSATLIKPALANWALAISVAQNGLTSAPVIVGEALIPEDHWTALCRSLPPAPIGLDPLRVYLPSASWPRSSGPYLADYRPPGDATTWHVEVSGGIVPGQFELQLHRLEMPPHLQVQIWDELSGEPWAPNDGEPLTFATMSSPRSLTMIIGESDSEDATSSSPTIDLAYPNPFSQATGFRFTVFDRADLDVTIYDVAGRRIRHLRRPNAGAGEHVLVWDGNGADGRRVAPGVYFANSVIGTGRSVTSRVVKVD